MKLSFRSLNIGLALMMFVNLIPLDAIQLFDSVYYGYWHARQPELFELPPVRFSE